MTAMPNEQQEPASVVFRALLESKPDAAAVGVSVAPIAGREVSLKGLISLAYRQAGNAKKADDWAKRMAEELGKQGRSERAIAAILTGAKPMDAKVFLESLIFPEEKRIVLFVAANQFPEHAAAFRKLAKILNVQRDEVSLVLEHLGLTK
jgi:hypothetical protein